MKGKNDRNVSFWEPNTIYKDIKRNHDYATHYPSNKAYMNARMSKQERKVEPIYCVVGF